jgi:hypothetical protein
MSGSFGVAAGSWAGWDQLVWEQLLVVVVVQARLLDP